MARRTAAWLIWLQIGCSGSSGSIANDGTGEGSGAVGADASSTSSSSKEEGGATSEADATGDPSSGAEGSRDATSGAETGVATGPSATTGTDAGTSSDVDSTSEGDEASKTGMMSSTSTEGDSDSTSASTTSGTETSSSDADDGSSGGDCPGSCDVDARACLGEDAVVECVEDARGCSSWVLVENCEANTRCEDGSCQPRCVDACAPGASRCESSDSVSTCRLGPDGCFVWTPPRSCSGLGCSDGACRLGAYEWEVLDSPTPLDLVSVWGSDATDVWAVGRSGVALRWDGNSWRSYDTGQTHRLTSVHGIAADEVYAIATSSHLIRFEGLAWSWVDRLDPDSNVAAVHAYAPGHVYAVTLDTSGGVHQLWSVQDGERELLDAWDQQWGVPWGSKGRTVSIDVQSPDDILLTFGTIVAFDGEMMTEAGPDAHWELWRPHPGLAYVSYGGGPTGRRYDGNSWSGINPGFGDRIHGFSGREDFVVAVGESDDQGAIAVFQDGAWSGVSLPQDTPPLWDVWMSLDGVVFAVGQDGVIVRGRPLVQR